MHISVHDAARWRTKFIYSEHWRTRRTGCYFSIFVPQPMTVSGIYSADMVPLAPA